MMVLQTLQNSCPANCHSVIVFDTLALPVLVVAVTVAVVAGSSAVRYLYPGEPNHSANLLAPCTVGTLAQT